MQKAAYVLVLKLKRDFITAPLGYKQWSYLSLKIHIVKAQSNLTLVKNQKEDTLRGIVL